jgi:hypothetical protein
LPWLPMVLRQQACASEGRQNCGCFETIAYGLHAEVRFLSLVE